LGYQQRSGIGPNGGNYQIKVFSQQMTKDELLRIVQSLTPVPATQ
jgi:hypothetical protein